MIDWEAVAAALHAPIKREDRASAIAPLETLERAFHPLKENIPLDTPLWSGPIESVPVHSTEAQPE